jgi:steroid 5-alpha reductase family enzyme
MLPFDIGHALWINFVLIMAYMTVWFVVARARKRLDTVDTAWGLGFVLLAWSVVWQHSYTQNIVIAILVTIWGVRLTSHIYLRGKKRDDDPRYLELSKKWKGNFWLRAYLSIFLLQGVLIWVISLPMVLAADRLLDGLSWLTAEGVGLWFLGFMCEAVADYQLTLYLRDKKRPKVLQTGLWRYSRHPNYFGELLQWWAIAVIASQTSAGMIGYVGPLVLTILIVFISGIPPIERRRAKDAAYRAYQQKTSVLIPWPPQK